MAKDFTVTRPGPKWVLNKDGVLVQFAEDFPSFEFNVDGTYKGTLIEEQRKNICLQSEDFSTTWSTLSDSSVISNQGVSPDGNTTADELTRTLSNQNSRVLQTGITVSNSTVYTVSIFLKNVDCNGGTTIGFRVTGGTLFRVKIDWSTNTISSFGGTTTNELIEYPNNWYRATMTFTTDGTSGNFEIDLDRDNPSELTSILIWGAQLEAGDKVSSYIKTTSSTETRNKDVITMSDASQYIPSEGAVIMEWEQREADTIYIGALSASVTAGVRKLRFEYSSTEQKLFIDDVEKDSLTGDFDFSGMDEIELGHINGVDQPNTHIRYFAIV